MKIMKINMFSKAPVSAMRLDARFSGCWPPACRHVSQTWTQTSAPVGYCNRLPHQPMDQAGGGQFHGLKLS